MGTDPVKLGLYENGIPSAQAGAAGQPAKVMAVHRLVEDPKHRTARNEGNKIHRQECVVCQDRVRKKGLEHHGKGKKIPTTKWICSECNQHYCVECFFEAEAHYVAPI